MFYFTPRWGIFSPFPHDTTLLLVTQEYLDLQGGPCLFTQDSTCPMLLRSEWCITPPLRLAPRCLYCSPTTPFSRFRLLPFLSLLLHQKKLEKRLKNG
ncbi:hypothetical protein KSP39_PZI004202 [Platanthera zijinensis]|uniref:Uncharacterized protein n=1 Tax=Platanthera zijinensis TaxID=2320716 RepID=A0AAP0BVW3_9ASPA